MSVTASTTDKIVRDAVSAPVPNQYYNEATSTFEVQKGIGGAASVSDITTRGTLKTVMLDPQTTFNAANAKEFHSDATGYKAFRVRPVGTLGAGVCLMVSYSTTAADTSTVNAALVAAKAEVTTPTGASLIDTVMLTDADDGWIWVAYDGTTKIKSIGVAVDSAYTGNAVLELVS